MRWSFPLVKIAGIQVTIHLTFFLILLWVALSVWRSTPEVVAVVHALGFIVALFVCVVMHEFGHALTARHFGIVTRSITLLPIGGVAAMEKMPEKPREELWVAIAGPLVNVAIASVLWLYLSMTGAFPELAAEQSSASALRFENGQQFWYALMVINVILAVFNMLPAFPMDGGRVLRAVLAMSMPHHMATERAAAVGQTLAIAMFVLGLLYNPLLMLISAFIWLGAAGESRVEQVQHALAKVAVTDVMVDEFHVINATDSIGDAIDLAIHTEQRYFPVRQNNGTLSVLNQEHLLKLSREANKQDTLAAIQLPAMETMASDDALTDIVSRLQRAGGVIAVMEGAELKGLVTNENLMQWISLAATEVAA